MKLSEYGVLAQPIFNALTRNISIMESNTMYGTEIPTHFILNYDCGKSIENNGFTLKEGELTDCVLEECEEHVDSYYGSGTVKYMKLTAPRGAHFMCHCSEYNTQVLYVSMSAFEVIASLAQHLNTEL